jgi:hypothetical protein
MPQIPITSALGYIGVFFLISGVFLIISGIGVIKIEKVTIAQGRQTWALGLVLAIVGFLFLIPEVNNGIQSISPTPTATATTIPTSTGVAATNTAIPTSTGIAATNTAVLQITPASLTVYNSPGTVHLGDESKQGWTTLSGSCSKIIFTVNLPLQSLTLQLETYGAESNNSLALNGNKLGIVPSQGVLQPDIWIESPVTISLPVEKLLNGENNIEICAEKVEVQPSFSGDLDDFQIRNISIIAQP